MVPLDTFLIVLLLTPSLAVADKKSRDSKLLVILVDGMRYDYLNDPSLVALQKLRSRGVNVHHVQPAFPTISYPNWYTISTGKYIESHGLIGNNFYDPTCNCSFFSAPDPLSQNVHFWNEAEPIWVTAERQGVRTAMFWWDGCSVGVGGYNGSHCVPYDEEHTFMKWFFTGEYEIDYLLAMDTIAKKFKDEEWRLAMVYFEALDGIGHLFGPNSPQTKGIMTVFDRIVDHFINRTEEYHIEDEVDIVILADHGMIDMSNVTVIPLQLLLNINDLFIYDNEGFYATIWPKPGREGSVYRALRNRTMPGMKVYLKDDIPERYHFKRNARIAPILVTADRGYVFDSKSNKKGGHGYDNEFEEMGGGFLAAGPGIKRASTSSMPLIQTDHYNLFCHLLGIEPALNNGSFERISEFLASVPHSTGHITHTSYLQFLVTFWTLVFLITRTV